MEEFSKELPDLSGAAVSGEAVAGKDRALKEYSLDEYQPGQWWLTELENHASHRVTSDDTRRAAGIALDFAAKVFSARAADAPSEPSELLYTAVMNIPCERTMSHFVTLAELRAYKEGHHAARHAAVNLVAAFKSRAADALDSQPTEPAAERFTLPFPVVIGDLTITPGTNLDARGIAQLLKNQIAIHASSQPADGGVRNG